MISSSGLSSGSQRERELLLSRQEDCLTWQQALLSLLERTAAERTFYRAILGHDGQSGLESAIPLEGVLDAIQAYYQDRRGTPLDPEIETLNRRCGQALLLSLVETWIRGKMTLSSEEIASSLVWIVEQSADGAMWQTLRERGEWNWKP